MSSYTCSLQKDLGDKTLLKTLTYSGQTPVAMTPHSLLSAVALETVGTCLLTSPPVLSECKQKWHPSCSPLGIAVAEAMKRTLLMISTLPALV